MSKRRIFVIALLVCCLAVMASGSVAYFTASETAHNVISSGSIAIDLQELTDQVDENGDPIPFEDATGVMPGTEVSKIVQVENTGDNAVWVRIAVEKAIDLVLPEGAEPVEPDLALIALDLNTADWTGQDGYYYYNKPLNPGDTTVPLFTTVTFDAAMGNCLPEQHRYPSASGPTRSRPPTMAPLSLKPPAGPPLSPRPERRMKHE